MNKSGFGGAVEEENEKRLKRVFMKTFKQIQNKELAFKTGLFKRKEYFIDMSENKKVKSVMIIPGEKIEEYKKWWAQNQNAVGFSILATNYGEEETRIGCYGMNAGAMQKTLAGATKRTLSYRLAKRSRK